MALSTLQRHVCRTLADARRADGESYVAGGVALSVALDTQRLSRDLDLFHDTAEAVARTWARDSAFRFFPLVEHADLGLTLHPFDLATNKVLALVGRLEARDWVDVIACHERLQPLGYLAWAACGKDPGFTPQGILEHARRSSRYSAEEIATLAFEGPPPSAPDLARRWHGALERAEAIIDRLPAAHVGEAVVSPEGGAFTGPAAAIEAALAASEITFHRGRLGGAWPRVRAKR